jgi:hypothetical protein
VAELNVNKALDLAKDLIETSEDGTKWVKVEDLKRLEAAQTVRDAVDQLGPRPRTMHQAKQLASQDPELREEFADRPPVLGPSPHAA